MTVASDCLFFFFFNDTATTEIYTLSLHDALPICAEIVERGPRGEEIQDDSFLLIFNAGGEDRKSTRLNSSHSQISYAVFCLKKKKKKTTLLVYVGTRCRLSLRALLSSRVWCSYLL